MPARLRTAACTRALIDAFAAEVAARPLGPLVRETVVAARANAMRAAVEAGLARALGCAASVEARSPRLVAAELARSLRLLPPAPGGRAYEAAALAWRIARILPAMTGTAHAPLVRYLARQDDAGRPGGRFALAARLAAAFEDYQLYRPDLLRAWAAGRTAAAGWPDEAWQADLWRRLLAEAPRSPDGAPEPDRAAVLASLVRRLRGPLSPAEKAALPARVSVFGSPRIPPVYLDVLEALGRHTDVTVYATVAGADGGRASDAPLAHPLARALGSHTPETARLLGGFGPPAHTPAEPPAGPPAAWSALHTLQHALRTDTPPDGTARLRAGDRSVRVLDAHSPLRELEALRDELLDAFDTLPGLRPEDVGILTPDLATVAPLAEAVFGTDGPAGARLPLHVADPPRTPERRVLDAVDRLLGLLDGRAAASDVLGLLDVPAVRRAARVAEAELGVVHGWVREARVHWGRDGAHKARHGLGADGGDDVHTWRFGLDRLLLGVLTGPTDAVVLGRRPLGEPTLDAADLLGRVAEWADALFARVEALRAPRPLAAWRDALALATDGLLAPETTAELDALAAFRAAAEALPELVAGRPGPDADPPVPLADVQAHLARALASLDRDEPYLTGRVTLAEISAARLVPFRVLAVVGLGDRFPRAESRPAFDHLAAERRAGDPDPAGADRQALLDAVLAAGDRLVLTYTGRSQRDNAERAPSAALEAVLDALRATFGPAAGALVVAHPLQPFSRRYGAAPGLERFGPAAPAPPPRPPRPFVRPPAADLERDDGDAPAEVDVEALARAWAHPTRFHAAARGLRPDLADAAHADDEPVDLDPRAAYALRADVLARLVAGADASAAYEAIRHAGRLPPGPLGAAWFERARGEVAPLAEAAARFGPAAAEAVDVDGGRWRVAGSVTAGPGGVLRVRPGRVGTEALVGAWVEHLALSASETRAAWPEGRVVGRGAAHAFEPLEPARARAFLQTLVRGMLAAERVPPPLFAHASRAYAEALRASDRRGLAACADRLAASGTRPWTPVRLGSVLAEAGADVHAGALRAAQQAFRAPWSPPDDASDAAVRAVWRGLDPVAAFPEAAARWARLLWAPLLTHLRDG